MDEGKVDSESEVKRRHQSPPAEDNKDSTPQVKRPPQSPPFLEVVCKSSGKVRRFSVGTEAGFAVSLMNKKLIEESGGERCSLATHIEAVKEGEEAVSFGPGSLLVNYGSGWNLQAAIESVGDGRAHIGVVPKATAEVTNDSHPERTPSPFTALYIGKIFLVFLLMFALAAVFTLALENLPQLILYINSSM